MNSTIERNFSEHEHTDVRVNLLRAGVRRRCKTLAQFLEEHLPPQAGREKAIALTHIESAMFFACAGLERNGPGPVLGGEPPKPASEPAVVDTTAEVAR